jgi:hypothetical protein
MQEQQNEAFHVVCRDCSFESLEQEASEARRLADEHASDADHTTLAERIQ